MINYISKYTPGAAQVCKPLRELISIRSDMEKPCYENDITDDTLPESFQLKLVAYASKSLTTAEQNYSNIECEALGVLHSLEKFHHYCYGCVVHVITDHGPLLSLMHKDVSNVSPKIAKITITNSQISCHDALPAWQGDAPCRLPIKSQSQTELGQ